MATFKNEKISASFELPDKITVRQQLAYFSEVSGAYGDALFERLWYGARELLTNWQCEAMPDVQIDLDKTEDPKVTDCVLWAGIEVKKYMDALDRIPKN